ncbi:deazaflavin-dependent nitroreductase [Mycobacterium sp. 852002-53434_SCH5985345]|uniref:nitroreductase family deazaflavin-dependent oxidoreductase n=1 Tax=unclassified Mycobacterium TaxID=2642494 RepID=UPI000800935C|nr:MULTISPECIES: nitroreductase family deazaflavin-dependent oxidoreductase [unclassified Mycobacterium]OBF49688.1 deazaflavin-dependent nitroreductase [Mycobacterium sp. 852002-53434_SCH5985345]OBF73146.1 deazaflavin-dependent nitroreductase [Mycobacterium sp. 852002-51613_SCH5001154]OBG00231.1 deazaflavin-dependent nitroreductase [Mycobacterium sp. 852014-52450_SCH5900713]
MSNPTPPRWLKPMNKFMIAMQKLGVPTGPPMVLTVPGRKTGKARSTPMTPFRLDGQLFAVAGFPGADWARNARAAGAGTLRKGRKVQRVRITELAAEQARPVLREYPNEVPVGVAFLKRSGLVRHGHPEEVEALAGRIAVFRLDPIPAS